MTKQFEGKFKVGDRVKSLTDDYADRHHGRDLEVLYMDEDSGYGVGIVGNDPTLDHDSEFGWVWYFPDEVGPVDD